MQIAAIRSRIKDVSNKTKQTIYLTALATAMSTCQSSSGHFAQYMPKEHPRIRALRQMDLFHYFQEKCMEIEIFISNYRNIVFGMDGVELLQSSELKSCAPPGSLVYLDPPYSSAQYSRYYHLLETVFLDDEPEVDFKGLYRLNRFQSDFSSPKKVTDAFEKVIKFSSLSHYNLIISYSDGGLIALDKLRNLCSNYYSTVELKYELYPHSMQGRGQLNDRHEVIVVSSNS